MTDTVATELLLFQQSFCLPPEFVPLRLPGLLVVVLELKQLFCQPLTVFLCRPLHILLMVNFFGIKFSVVSLRVYSSAHRTRAYFEKRGVLFLFAKRTDLNTNVPPAKNSWWKRYDLEYDI